jgi:holliday junction DNA helicase RuvA
MIGKITGVLIHKAPPSIVVDVNGVGYEIDVPMSTLYALPANGEKVSLVTQLIVREDAHLLYGFATEAERGSFRQLLKISGIGPKVALAVLSGLSVDELASAIASQDVARLTRIPGIGKKTAERLLLELKGKLVSTEGGSIHKLSSPSSMSSDVLNALLGLGYSEREANGALVNLPPDLSVSDAIRLALKTLAK